MPRVGLDTMRSAGENARSRVVQYDALRGLAVLLVVLAHAIALPNIHEALTAVESGVYSLITSVYMPLFAFLSGLVQGRFSGPVTWPVVRRRAFGLMVPYFAWAIIRALGLLWSPVVRAHPVGWLLDLGAVLVDPRAASLWFLYALFMCYVLAAVVRGVNPSTRALVASAAIIAAVAFFPVPNWLGARDVAWLFPFFVLGLLEAGSGRMRRRVVVLGAAALYTTTLAMIWPLVGQGEQWWLSAYRSAVVTVGFASEATTVWIPNRAILLGRYACAAAGVTLLYNLFMSLPSRRVGPLASIGRRSLGVYALHSWAIEAGIAVGVHSTAILFGVATAVSLVVTNGLERVPLTARILLGRTGRNSSHVTQRSR
jgi:fucose 4-O-acetylase-like acetyltransferase